MKKLMIAALLACSMCVVADEPAAPKPEAGRRPTAPERQKMTPEQRREFTERMQAARKARMAEMQTKVIDTLKEAGLTDEQAKTTAEKIEQIYMAGRPGGAHGGHGGRQGQNGRRRARPEAK